MLNERFPYRNFDRGFNLKLKLKETFKFAAIKLLNFNTIEIHYPFGLEFEFCLDSGTSSGFLSG